MAKRDKRKRRPIQASAKKEGEIHLNKKKFPLAFWIFIGLCVGIVAGLILMTVPNGVDFAESYIKPFGTIFLNLLKFVVVPIVLFSIAAGVISMGDIKKVGSVGGKTIVYYMCTTAFAIALALVLASIAQSLHLFTPPGYHRSGIYASRESGYYGHHRGHLPLQRHCASGQRLHAPGYRHCTVPGLRHSAGR